MAERPRPIQKMRKCYCTLLLSAIDNILDPKQAVSLLCTSLGNLTSGRMHVHVCITSIAKVSSTATYTIFNYFHRRGKNLRKK